MGESPKGEFAGPRASEDGTREGGLVFLVVVILGMIVATIVYPPALTSFFVWFALLMLAVSIAVAVQRLTVLWFHGGAVKRSEYDRFRTRRRSP